MIPKIGGSGFLCLFRRVVDFRKPHLAFVERGEGKEGNRVKRGKEV
jgi:hypothetical protein